MAGRRTRIDLKPPGPGPARKPSPTSPGVRPSVGPVVTAMPVPVTVKSEQRVNPDTRCSPARGRRTGATGAADSDSGRHPRRRHRGPAPLASVGIPAWRRRRPRRGLLGSAACRCVGRSTGGPEAGSGASGSRGATAGVGAGCALAFRVTLHLEGGCVLCPADSRPARTPQVPTGLKIYGQTLYVRFSYDAAGEVGTMQLQASFNLLPRHGCIQRSRPNAIEKALFMLDQYLIIDAPKYTPLISK